MTTKNVTISNRNSLNNSKLSQVSRHSRNNNAGGNQQTRFATHRENKATFKIAQSMENRAPHKPSSPHRISQMSPQMLNMQKMKTIRANNASPKLLPDGSYINKGNRVKVHNSINSVYRTIGTLKMQSNIKEKLLEKEKIEKLQTKLTDIDPYIFSLRQSTKEGHQLACNSISL